MDGREHYFFFLHKYIPHVWKEKGVDFLVENGESVNLDLKSSKGKLSQIESFPYEEACHRAADWMWYRSSVSKGGRGHKKLKITEERLGRTH